MIYILLAIMLFISDIFLKKNISVYILVYIAFFVIGGFRDVSVGTDTVNYLEIYDYIKIHGDSRIYAATIIEPLWFILNILASILFDDYQSVLVISNFLVITPIFLCAWKYERPFRAILFFLLLFFFGNSLNIMRQMIAVSFAFCGYHYYLKGCIKRYVVLILFAALFHYTALFILLVPFVLQRLQISAELVLFLLPLTYIMGIYLIPALIPNLPIVGKYAYYFIEDARGNVSLTRLVLNLFFIFIYLGIKKDKILTFYIKLLFVGICIYNLFSFSPAVGRLALYFMISQLYIYSHIESKFKSNIKMVKLSLLLYGVFYFSMMLLSNSCEILPYKFFTM